MDGAAVLVERAEWPPFLGKSCSFSLLCVAFLNVFELCVCASFPFGYEGGMWDLILLIPDYCLCLYLHVLYWFRALR